MKKKSISLLKKIVISIVCLYTLIIINILDIKISISCLYLFSSIFILYIIFQLIASFDKDLLKIKKK